MLEGVRLFETTTPEGLKRIARMISAALYTENE
jgi:hypothetical protein